MTLEQYKEKIKEIGFDEYPHALFGNEKNLFDIVDYESCTLELKIHLAKVIICRCFSPTGAITLPANSNWFISNFFRTYDKDMLRPWLSNAIKAANEMIANDTFTGIIGTTFMFGVIEFYAKHKLGFRPNEFDFFDKNKKNYIKDLYKNSKKIPPELSIGKAFELLQQKDFPIAVSLNDIDKKHIQRFEEIGIKDERWIKIKIADRLSLSRNAMLHGEDHSFYEMGEYLLMIYILFHLHELKEAN